jgi:CDP-diacylglycerol---glycerol-3-phosphate 3-phosphatidyltransferase
MMANTWNILEVAMTAGQQTQTGRAEFGIGAREPSPFNLPNFLTLLRFLMAIGMFVLIGLSQWGWTGFLFFLASVTDWLDGVAARRLGIISSFGRSFDPLVDKLLICGAYTCLIPVADSGVAAWMVVVVVTRELLVTSLRGYIESLGIPFGADYLGKIKMVLQCLALAMILLCLLLNLPPAPTDWYEYALVLIRDVLIYAMVAATVLSGLQYLWSSYLLYRRHQQNV